MVGRLLGETYRLVRLMGEGGMGAVYEAKHTRLDKRFAVKLLRGGLIRDKDGYLRFQREAMIASRLGHPHIVEVIDFHHDEDGQPYMVMEYLEGEDLEALLCRGLMEPRRLLKLVQEVGSALQAAHDSGVVHRDLKPQNIFLCRFGSRADFPKVLDFGISKVQGPDETALTLTNTAMGTPSYMSPEQAEGNSAKADARSDIFSLGAVMYRALAGKLPFEGSSHLDVMYNIVHSEAEPVHSRVQGIPVPVSRVVQRAMAKAPADRYASMAQLIRALEVAVEGDASDPALAATAASVSDTTAPPAQTGPAPGPQQGTDSPSTTPVVSPGSRPLLLALVGLVTLGSAVWFWSSLEDAGQRPVSAHRPSQGPGSALVASAVPDAGSQRSSATLLLATALQSRTADIERCALEFVGRNPDLHGEVRLRIKVDKTGRIGEVDIAKDGLGSPALATCIMTQFKGLEGLTSIAGKTVMFPVQIATTRVVAILPFANLSGDASLDWLRGGIAETLMVKLGQVPRVALADRGQLKAALKKTKQGAGDAHLTAAAKSAKASLVITGAFQRQGGKVRLTARLLRARDGKVRATATATGELKKIFSVQDELARRLAKAMNFASSPQAIKALALRTGKTLAILRLLGEAANALDGIGEPANSKKAEVLFRQVITVDPGIPEAYLGLVRALWSRKLGQGNSRDMEELRSLLAKALELRPDYHEVLTRMGLVLWTMKRHDEALEVHRRAVKLKPQYAEGYFGLALAYATRKGKEEEALIMMRQASNFAPWRTDYLTSMGLLKGMLKGDYQGALVHTGEALKRKDASLWHHTTHAFMQLMSGDPRGCLANILKGRKAGSSPPKNYQLQSLFLEMACRVKQKDTAGALAIWAKLSPEDRKLVRHGPPQHVPWFVAAMFQQVRKIVRPVLAAGGGR